MDEAVDGIEVEGTWTEGVIMLGLHRFPKTPPKPPSLSSSLSQTEHAWNERAYIHQFVKVQARFRGRGSGERENVDTTTLRREKGGVLSRARCGPPFYARSRPLPTLIGWFERNAVAKRSAKARHTLWKAIFLLNSNHGNTESYSRYYNFIRDQIFTLSLSGARNRLGGRSEFYFFHFLEG